MANRKGKLPASYRAAPQTDSGYRAVTVHAADAQDTNRVIGVTLATGEGVDVYDRKRGHIKEYLDMTGAVMPRQAPLVDSHNHGSVRNILGSLRDFSLAGQELRAKAHFASKPAAAAAYQDMREGHLTDISVGFFRQQEHYVEAGQTGDVNGRTVQGPARIVTRWQPFEGSAVTVGADRHSTFGSVPALRTYFDVPGLIQEAQEAMNEQYRNLLVSLGMDAALDDAAALDWAKANVQKRQAEPPVVPVVPKVEPTVNDDAVKAERSRVAGIYDSCRKHGVSDKDAKAMVDEGLSIDAASTRILNQSRKGNDGQPLGTTRIEFTGSHTDGFRAAVLDGVRSRITAGKFDEGHKPAVGHEEFRNVRLLDLARRCLQEEGTETRRLSERDVWRQAMDVPHSNRSDGQAYLTTGAFANLLLDAMHKELLRSFTMAPTTYQMWARQATSVSDFKTQYRMRLGEIGNQPVVAENDDYKDMSISDLKEGYKVEKHGSVVSLTWEATKNDDLGGFSRIVQLQGAAMKNTLNRSVYQVFFDNAALQSDSIALFHSSHGSNTTTGALSVANLNTAYSAMMLQTGLNTDVILGIVPRYLIVPPGISGTAMQLLNSVADPAAGGSAVGNSNNLNIYGPGGGRFLSLIVEPILAGNDVDAWYLVADNSQVDTVEFAFLQGEESPVFEQESAFIQDAVKYKIRQTWGVKAIDYRGLYRSTG